MHVVYDGWIFRWQRAGGINRYFQEVVQRLPHDWAVTFLGLARGNSLPVTHSRLARRYNTELRPRRWSQRLQALWWSRTLLQSNALFHPTYYFLNGGLRWQDVKQPVVLTVHDFIHASYPGQLDNHEETLRAQCEAIERADHLICVSEATRSQLLERFPGLSKPVSVIHHGASFGRTRLNTDAAPDAPPLFLFVGARHGYKNFSFLVRAFARAVQTLPQLRLHVVGAPLTPEEQQFIASAGLAGQVQCSVFPSEDELQALYRRSTALLYPSLHEGFGIPPLEAMICGTIPVTGNNTSLPEVMGDCGIMLDASNSDQWTECILSLARGLPDREDLRQKGLARAAQFTWENSAARHVEVYRSLVA